MTIQQNFEDRDKVKITVSEYGSGFYRRYGKRIFDVALALVLLPFLLPIITILALFIMVVGGTALFGHNRVGQGGRVFKCWKLRSMCINADTELERYLRQNPEAEREWRETYKLTNDPRITRIGGFIRKTSLDELPQIFNVLAGEMSFVGPRPVIEEELIKYGIKRCYYETGRPGVTGAWQIGGRNDVTYAERVEMDVEYRRKESFVTDLKIILLTPLAIISPTGR